ncbi:unnamed protein product [Miscanthus lutarioriparius]|uniref:VTT domain-containing protein n=1 Tax=Miscanthus lutarioriparius TaxID=422564 RepID=A0A811QAX5_9POAL|nr:unnamed protein product [Miscanthus lutarioriparius]
MGLPGSANGRHGEYVRIPEEVEVSNGEGDAAAAVKAAAAAECPRVLRCHAIRWWAKVAVLGIVLAGAGAAAVVFLGPLLIKKVVAPILYWESTTFSRPAIALICFGAIALFPSVLLPSSPFMWLAGMTFGYLYNFLIITVGMSIGISLPYFIGSAFHCRIHRWLEKWPKKAAFVRLAGEGDWHHQFKAVALLRISPFPYIVFYYASMATNVKYYPYIAGTIHETFLAIYRPVERLPKGGVQSALQPWRQRPQRPIAWRHGSTKVRKLRRLLKEILLNSYGVDLMLHNVIEISGQA